MYALYNKYLCNNFYAYVGICNLAKNWLSHKAKKELTHFEEPFNVYM